MNDVESYLRKSGGWYAPISTDTQGRACCGQEWWPTYYAQWLDAHDRNQLSPGGWTQDKRSRDWWVTTTPDWDRQWFQRRGVQPPKRFGDKSRTFWEYGSPNLGSLRYNSGGWLTPSRLIGSVALVFLTLSIIALVLAFTVDPRLIDVAVGAGLLLTAICGVGYEMVRITEVGGGE